MSNYPDPRRRIREADKLEREAEHTLDEKRRRELRSLARDLRDQQRKAERPRC